MGVDVVCICLIFTYKDTKNISLPQLFWPFSYIELTFNYDEEMKRVERKNYNDEEWNDIIYEQIEKGMPVLYSGFSLDNSGHTSVCDGYENGYFHINWGWNGAFNGWFLIASLR